MVAPRKTDAQRTDELKASIIGHMRKAVKFKAVAVRTQDPEYRGFYNTLADTHQSIAVTAMKRMKMWLENWRPSEAEIMSGVNNEG